MTAETDSARLRTTLHGAVQGVGFRPFIHRLAVVLGLQGWVVNSAQGLVVEVEGGAPVLKEFQRRLVAEKPPSSVIQSIESVWLDPVGFWGFEIRPSDPSGAKTAFIMPDLATCPECLREVLDPDNRRYRYPFTNCTHCGPRFSIIRALPYDRASTTMNSFIQCLACEAEYHDPANRRFHAQPNACPVCGPRLSLWNGSGEAFSSTSGEDPIIGAAGEIFAGRVVAIKGLGGFQLVVDAQNPEAIQVLRKRKQREEKPFAVMFPSLEWVRRCCVVSREEEQLLDSPQAPIVLVARRTDGAAHRLPEELAPGNPWLGVMLPCTPLHHLLLRELDRPVVATSGNLSDEPICIDELEALVRLKGIADCFLVHNRPIQRHVDDSIVRVALGREMILRRARGYAPLPISLPVELGRGPDVLAVGGHLKNTVALGMGSQVWISQHIGDLETSAAHHAFESAIGDLQTLYGATPAIICADLHPDYASTRHASRLTSDPGPARLPALRQLQHHVAHVLGCMAENDLRPPVLGVAWDGTGHGLDGTIWGGEFFLVSESGCRRVAHLRKFRLAGGDKAVREPRRTALGLLYELLGEAIHARTGIACLNRFTSVERKNLLAMLKGGLNSPVTSSAGRLFDGVAALLGLRDVMAFEGQAAMNLEFITSPAVAPEPYSFSIEGAGDAGPMLLDWGPMIGEILRDVEAGTAVGDIAARFHTTLAGMIVGVAQRMKALPLSWDGSVALSGGCFQNIRLLGQTVQGLQAAGFRPYWHQRIPPNDGGISLGQVVGVRRGIV